MKARCGSSTRLREPPIFAGALRDLQEWRCVTAWMAGTNPRIESGDGHDARKTACRTQQRRRRAARRLSSLRALLDTDVPAAGFQGLAEAFGDLTRVGGRRLRRRERAAHGRGLRFCQDERSRHMRCIGHGREDGVAIGMALDVDDPIRDRVARPSDVFRMNVTCMPVTRPCSVFVCIEAMSPALASALDDVRGALARS